MRTYRFVAPGAALLLALAPIDAQAVDGTITGLTADPSPADVNQDVVIRVLGTQKCKKVSVDFGDNSPPAILNNPDFENNNLDEDSVTHAYSNDGNYKIVASAVDQCSGGAQTSLTVGAGGGTASGLTGKFDEILCVILDNCPTLKKGVYVMLLLPHIEALFPFSVVEPGGNVIVLGNHFGDTQGELHMVLKTDNKDVKLEVKDWSDGHVGGKIPITTSGVVDQKAEFYVKKSSGSESNRHGDASFTARRKLEVLPRSDVALDQCGFDSNCDRCLTTYDTSDLDSDCQITSPRPTGTVTGFHKRDIATVGNAKGIDTYKLKAPLKNGWKLDHVVLDWWPDPGEKSATPSLTASQIKLDWWVSPHDSFWYDLYVMIKGPAGTPHK